MKKGLLKAQLEKIQPLLEEQAEMQAILNDYHRFVEMLPNPSHRKSNEVILAEQRLRELKMELQKLMIEYYHHLPVRSVDEGFDKFKNPIP